MAAIVNALEVVRAHRITLTGARPSEIFARVDTKRGAEHVGPVTLKYFLETTQQFEVANDKPQLNVIVKVAGRGAETENSPPLIELNMTLNASFSFAGDAGSIKQALADNQDLQFALYSQVHPVTLREYGKLLNTLGAQVGDSIPLGISLGPGPVAVQE